MDKKEKHSKVTVTSLQGQKVRGQKITVVTAYDATLATLFDRAGVDVLMVGDSLGMVVQGHETTLPVTLDHMIYHCQAVQRARPRAHVVCDLPFLSYQVSSEDALRSAGRLIKEGGAEAVKLEGGEVVAAAVAHIVKAGIPVMGHVGLTPQSINAFGGFRIQGRTSDAARRIVRDAQALERAGVYAIVVEGVPSELGRLITESVTVPTIGIGAGPMTDGQVLVCYDLLGLYPGKRPKFVKEFASLATLVEASVAAFVEEVRQGSFPGAEHVFEMASPEELERLRAADGSEG